MAGARREGVAALAAPFAAGSRTSAAAPGGTLRLETSPVEPRRRSPATPSRRRSRARWRSAARARSRPPRRSRGRTATTSGSARGAADLRREGSQGEQRTAALALLLAARDHLRARAARPILLLDDVLSELDPVRRRLLLEAVRDGGQTLVTSADPGAADALAAPPDALVRVGDGRLDA